MTHRINLRDKDTFGSPPVKYAPRVLVSTLPESWPIPPLTCVSRWIKTENVAAAVKDSIAADCLLLVRLKVREPAEISNVNLRLS
jgi:hypothetical protein